MREAARSAESVRTHGLASCLVGRQELGPDGDRRELVALDLSAVFFNFILIML